MPDVLMAEARRGVSELEQFVHIHIGKTAGTSLRNMLEQASGGGWCSPPFVQSYMTKEDAVRYSRFAIVSGHISRADQLKWFNNRKIFTVLRDPIDRCLSFIYYAKSLPPEVAEVAADARRLPTLELIETVEAQYNLNNTMVRQLGGHLLDVPACFPTLLERAKETLRQAMWVGRYNALDRDLMRLEQALKVPISLRHDNVTPGRLEYADEDPRLLNRLYELNGYDYQLWQWAEREFR